MSPYVAIFLAPMIAALIVVVVALRGQRIGTEPRCSRCLVKLARGFGDASAGGASNRGGLDLPRCPSCGRRLDRPRAIRLGIHHQHIRAFAVGLSVLVACIVLLCIGHWSNRQRLQKFKPDSLLFLEAQIGGPEWQDSVAREFARRIYFPRNDRLPPDPRLKSLVLRVRQDQTRPWWGTSWPDLLAAVERAGSLSPEERVASQDATMKSFSLRSIPRKLPPGRPLLDRADLRLKTLGRTSGDLVRVTLAAIPRRVMLAGRVLHDGPLWTPIGRVTHPVVMAHTPFTAGDSGSFMSLTWTNPVDLSTLPPGTHTLDVEWQVDWVRPNPVEPRILAHTEVIASLAVVVPLEVHIGADPVAVPPRAKASRDRFPVGP